MRSLRNEEYKMITIESIWNPLITSFLKISFRINLGHNSANDLLWDLDYF